LSTGPILVVEDEKNVAEVVQKYLERDGFSVHVLNDGRSALHYLESNPVSMVVLDIMLPGADGYTIARRLRESGDETPIVMLTARTADSDAVLGLGLGADDYVRKPFSPAELVARVHAVFRRQREGAAAQSQVITAGDIELDPEQRTVTVSDEAADLTAREFDLLHYMVTNPGRVLTRGQILDSVWGFDYQGDESTVTVHIRRLRSKIEVEPDRPRYIKTVWSVGYKFDPD
jgi:DNA-binding response OmpR family regulator